MSITLKNRIYEALNLSGSTSETADLIDWKNLRADADLGKLAACYMPEFNIIKVSQKHIDALLASDGEAEILTVLLHERAHQFAGKIMGDSETHNALFAGIAWGLQARAGVESYNKNYDIQDEPEGLQKAQDTARRIAESRNPETLINGLMQCRRDRNKRQAVSQVPLVLLTGLGIPAGLLLLTGNAGHFLRIIGG